MGLHIADCFMMVCPGPYQPAIVATAHNVIFGPGDARCIAGMLSNFMMLAGFQIHQVYAAIHATDIPILNRSIGSGNAVKSQDSGGHGQGSDVIGRERWGLILRHFFRGLS